MQALRVHYLYFTLGRESWVTFPEYTLCSKHFTRLQGGSDGKAPVYNAGDPGSIPESGRSPGEGNSNPLQYSYLENPMDGGSWWATVLGVSKSWTRLSDFTSLHKATIVSKKHV